eukprot:scaffold122937_cov30-Tisochrysis_lutea.AAC.4
MGKYEAWMASQDDARPRREEEEVTFAACTGESAMSTPSAAAAPAPSEPMPAASRHSHAQTNLLSHVSRSAGCASADGAAPIANSIRDTSIAATSSGRSCKYGRTSWTQDGLCENRSK